MPHPVVDYATIQTAFEPGSPAQVSLLEISGRIVSEQAVQIDHAGKIRINLDNYSSGMYYLRIRSDEEVEGTRIMINGR